MYVLIDLLSLVYHLFWYFCVLSEGSACTMIVVAMVAVCCYAWQNCGWRICNWGRGLCLICGDVTGTHWRSLRCVWRTTSSGVVCAACRHIGCRVRVVVILGCRQWRQNHQSLKAIVISSICITECDILVDLVLYFVLASVVLVIFWWFIYRRLPHEFDQSKFWFSLNLDAIRFFQA